MRAHSASKTRLTALMAHPADRCRWRAVPALPVSGHETTCRIVKQLVDFESARNDVLLQGPVDRELKRLAVGLDSEGRNGLERFRRRRLPALDDHAENLLDDVGTL